MKFEKLNMVEDLLAPASVVGVDILTLEALPEYNNYAAYIMTGVGYLGALMGWGGFVKNIGIASLPLTARHIYAYVKAQGGTTSRASRSTAARFALQPVSHRAAPAVSRMYQSEFEAAGSHAF